MPVVRPEKKSETLEVRLGHAAKTAFMDQCRRNGSTASDVVRDFIDGRIRGKPARRSSIGMAHALAAAVAGLAIGAAAAPSVAQTGTHAPTFERLDGDRDGVLTPAEFAAR